MNGTYNYYVIDHIIKKKGAALVLSLFLNA